MSWNDERVELLKKLWSDGLSASQIANELGGGVSRNAVIGKVHRLGLSGRAKPASPLPTRPVVRAPRAPAHSGRNGGNGAGPSNGVSMHGRMIVQGNTALAVTMSAQVAPVAEAVVMPEDVVIPMSQRVTLVELREQMCRWPMGDPQHADFRFCGAKSPIGTPYCNYHSRIAYQPAQDRRRDNRPRPHG